MSDENKDMSKAIGGRARKAALAPEERIEIAKKAAAARWNAEVTLPTATHEGDLKIGEASIPCAVLDDGRRLLTQSGFMVALGRARQAKGRQHYDGDVNMPAFLTAKNLKPFIPIDLAVTSSQVEFKTARGTKAFGYAAELLPKVCEVFLKAESAGALLSSQKHIAVQARVLLIGLASTGIVALVDEATGYQAIRPQDALQAYLEKVISKELAAWVKKFPDEFYENIYKLRGWTWPGMGKNRYSVVGTYTRDLVFERLAPGLLPELESKSPKNEKGNRSHKLHQWLSDEIGNPMLAQHMHSLVMFQRLAIANGYGWNRFVKMVDQVLPKKGSTLELPLDEPDQPKN
ncbi:P63C domain-containing protein [Massilia soli]|uniref:P63C domain-containing protein n=1 Tax=Massilia soli TaxID=2792854 RepID=A0ABS7SK78_9BURK|nr:P63C domain-containing protein [Massilia soli]MBZ2206604.1 P63C domain-containing protein [Massilia soli]